MRPSFSCMGMIIFDQKSVGSFSGCYIDGYPFKPSLL